MLSVHRTAVHTVLRLMSGMKGRALVVTSIHVAWEYILLDDIQEVVLPYHIPP